MTLAQLRRLQDWNIRYELTAVPGVSEVASLGGFVKQYQVELDPGRLLAYGIPITAVMAAIQNANADIGARVVEMAEREYMVRGLGYLRSHGGHRERGGGRHGQRHPDPGRRTGAGERGPRCGGARRSRRPGRAWARIVIMRFGQNALTTIERVKAKLARDAAGPARGRHHPAVYDRSELIHRAIATLREKLVEEA